MARPRLLLTPAAALDAFESFGSVRGASRQLRVARSVVARCLTELGIELPDRQDAYDNVRFLEGVTQPTKLVVRRTRVWGSGEYGVTVIRTLEAVPIVVCWWPGCEVEAKSGVLCRGHARFITATRHRRAGGTCCWPECGQDARPDGRLCYGHDKKLRAA